MTTFGTFEQLLDLTRAELRPIVERLRQLVFEIHEDATEVVRLGDRAATYGLGPRKMSEGYAYILRYERWVSLGFYQGAGLRDPENILEGSGIRMRHVKVRRIDHADSPALRALVEKARQERRDALSR